MDIFALADRLGKTIEELGQITVEEFTYWRAYHKIAAERLQESLKKK